MTDGLIEDFAVEAARSVKGDADPEKRIVTLAKRRYNQLSEAQKRAFAELGMLRSAPDLRFRTLLAHEMYRRGMERALALG